MFGNKKKKDVEQETKKHKIGSFDGVKELAKMVFKKREYKIEARDISKDDKKAAIITVIILVVVGLLLWFLPVTHKFFEDIIFLRV